MKKLIKKYTATTIVMVSVAITIIMEEKVVVAETALTATVPVAISKLISKLT